MKRTNLGAGRKFAAALAAALILNTGGAAAATAANVILMIGDGMGLEHLKAAGHYAHGREGSTFIESLPRQARVVTCSAYAVPTNAVANAVEPKITDSAAAATAFATGRKVYNGVLSVALPGDGKPLVSALELAQAAGKRTGLVTTSFLTDATPAAFGAHVKARTMQKEVAAALLKTCRPTLMLGGGSKDKIATLNATGGEAAGYKVAIDRAGLKALIAETPERILGVFSAGPMCYEFDHATTTRKEYDRIPHLSEMAAAALEFLPHGTNGFFLMIEGGCIDKAAHGNHLERDVYEAVEFDRTVAQVVAWAQKRGDTLVLVTADHETGGLKVTQGNGEGKMPTVTWSSKGHTGANVGLFAMGPGSESIAGTLDNTDIFRLLTGAFTGPTKYVPPVGEAGGGMANDKD